jgi:hypothetical protein
MQYETLALDAPRVPAAAGNGGLNLQNLNDPGAPVQVQVVQVVQVVQASDTIFENDQI